MCKKSGCVILLLLAAGVVQARVIEWDRAAYWDTRYNTNWTQAAGALAIKDGLEAAGYAILNADQLKDWMLGHISDKAASVVVMCQDVAPATVVDATPTKTCTIRKYLDAGGKIVWPGDIPFYRYATLGRVYTTTNWGDAGALGVLGFYTASAPRDTGTRCTITPLGKAWGLTTTWIGQRPALPTVTDQLDILATDASGNANAWVKHYVANDTYRGLVRFFDKSGTEVPVLADIIRLAEHVQFAAWNPSPADGQNNASTGYLTWSAGAFCKYHEIYFGTSPDLNGVTPVRQTAGKMGYAPPIWEPNVTYYWKVNEIDPQDGAVYEGDTWSFTTPPKKAFGPTPASGARYIDPSAVLTWQMGQDAYLHELYFSTNKAAVESRDQAALQNSPDIENLSFTPGTLLAATTYYWAVDETDLDDLQTSGDVWSFTTYGPEDGAQGEYFNGLMLEGAPALVRADQTINFNWAANGPGSPIPVDTFSARWTADLKVDVADTYTFTTNTDDGVRLWLDGRLIVDSWINQGATDHASAALALTAGIHALKMEYYENTGSAVARLDWRSTRFTRQPVPFTALTYPRRARLVYPWSGAANLELDPILQWEAGGKAAQHDVYFGTDANAVASATPDTGGIYQGRQALDELTFTPDPLAWGTTYYWRVDEINSGEAGSPWVGSIWSFTTQDFLPVDDFESYNDIDNCLYDAWLDQWPGTWQQWQTEGGAFMGRYADPANGDMQSVSGTGTFGDTTVFHAPGRQSMPIAYRNAGSQLRYSEVMRTFDKAQDWTINDVNTLSLWVRGRPVSYLDKGNGAFTISGSGHDIWDAADDFRLVYKQLNGNGSILVKVESLVNTNAWAKAGVMIRQDLTPGSTMVYMIVSWSSGVSFGHRDTADVACVGGSSFTKAGIIDPQWVKLVRNGNAFTAQYSADGQNWTDAVNANGQVATVTIPMGPNVYIGLCVTSHDSTLTNTADFSGAATTGTVTGGWQEVWIGDDPDLSNSLAPLYVIVEDSTGKVSPPVSDATVVTATSWTNCKFPLTAFTGVDLSRVRRLYLGVGDRQATTPDGSGSIWIDDIRVTR